MNEQKRARRKPLPPSPEWVTIREVASYLCVSESAVSRGAKPGHQVWPFNLLRRVEVGARVIFTRASFNHMARVMRRMAEAGGDVVPIEEGRDRASA